jgi:hypothetical protein
MSISGGCGCNNIKITWHTVDHSMVPRACQCDYCLSKAAAYVTKSGTRFDVLICNDKLHKEVQHGSNSAIFHECTNCGQVIFVTSDIDGEVYGALNANCLNNKLGFSASVKANFSDQTAEQKRERWLENWCHPVLITRRGSRDGLQPPLH